MSGTSDLLFSFLRDIFYAKSDSELDTSQLEEDYVLLGKGLSYFAHCVFQYNEYAHALARGDLDIEPPPRDNELTAPLKSLQANLKHLTWQSQQVAKGDYKQRVDFMGQFADAFNIMVEQLADRQEKLEEEIIASRKHAEAMEQSNLLLSKLTQYIPEQIFVVSADKFEVLLANDLAVHELDKAPDYLTKLMILLCGEEPLQSNQSCEVRITQDDAERYLEVNSYLIEWRGENAIALVVKDVSAEKKQMIKLEAFAYRDALTNVYNRFYGMITLNEWLESNKRFSLIFVDLDNLKYVNDKYGHKEGDIYIKNVSKHLLDYSAQTVVCRLGGDEFMLLAPESSLDDACERMEELQYAVQNDEYLSDKEFYYSISFGIVSVDENNDLSSSEMLSMADERMYEHKRARKKERQIII